MRNEEMSEICLTENCVDCYKLPICEKEKNEYNEEKVEKYLDSLYCPKCGFELIEDVKGKGACILCLMEE